MGKTLEFFLMGASGSTPPPEMVDANIILGGNSFAYGLTYSGTNMTNQLRFMPQFSGPATFSNYGQDGRTTQQIIDAAPSNYHFFQDMKLIIPMQLLQGALR